MMHSGTVAMPKSTSAPSPLCTYMLRRGQFRWHTPLLGTRALPWPAPAAAAAAAAKSDEAGAGG
jgi:hypothetical protein